MTFRCDVPLDSPPFAAQTLCEAPKRGALVSVVFYVRSSASRSHFDDKKVLLIDEKHGSLIIMTFRQGKHFTWA